MDVSEELAGMTADQLRDALSQADLELEDVLEERAFVLGQTGMHIGTGELARLQKSWEKDEARVHERIDAINARLAELESAP